MGISGFDPRNAVLIVLAVIMGLGLAHKARTALRTRRALARLAGTTVTPGEIAAAAQTGRDSMTELVRLHETGTEAPVREAAAIGLLSLWANDHLVAEEEKAIASRLYEVRWHARRRYPRALRRPIPVSIAFGLAGMSESAPIRPRELEWSHRVTGSQRAALECFSNWEASTGVVSFELEPGDFPASGPHRLVLESRLRWGTAPSDWELRLPPNAWSFELDPGLALDAILGTPDEERIRAMQASVRLAPSADGEPSFEPIDSDFALRNPPALVIDAPLPFDLAHRATVEFEIEDARCEAGPIVVAVRSGRDHFPATFPLRDLKGLRAGTFDRPQLVRLRLRLTPDPELAWCVPEIRALAPAELITDWCETQVVRR